MDDVSVSSRPLTPVIVHHPTAPIATACRKAGLSPGVSSQDLYCRRTVLPPAILMFGQALTITLSLIILSACFPKSERLKAEHLGVSQDVLAIPGEDLIPVVSRAREAQMDDEDRFQALEGRFEERNKKDRAIWQMISRPLVLPLSNCLRQVQARLTMVQNWVLTSYALEHPEMPRVGNIYPGDTKHNKVFTNRVVSASCDSMVSKATPRLGKHAGLIPLDGIF
ncbi:hypothetical protein FRC04_005261 [Tulasnella sp. 424]|nr:hypothetical protein FRC04_005261 [Tulasnella sp. 424]